MMHSEGRAVSWSFRQIISYLHTGSECAPAWPTVCSALDARPASLSRLDGADSSFLPLLSVDLVTSRQKGGSGSSNRLLTARSVFRHPVSHWAVEADLELFCNSWSAGFLGERLYLPLCSFASQPYHDAPRGNWSLHRGPLLFPPWLPRWYAPPVGECICHHHPDRHYCRHGGGRVRWASLCSPCCDRRCVDARCGHCNQQQWLPRLCP